jgi:hypothetical protein
MKRLTANQNGFGFIAILAAIALVGVVAVAGVRVMNSNKVASTIPSLTSLNHGVPAKIQTTTDLTKANTALDDTPIDSGVNPNQLDKDLNSLL